MRLFVLFLILLPQLVWSSPAEDPEERSVAILDAAQNIFGNRVNALANRLDAFFATERADDEFGRSTIRVNSAYTIREREVSDLSTRYRINLRLPHLEEKFKWRYYQDEKDKDEDENISDEEREKRRKANEIKKNWLFNADAGVSMAIPPRLRTRARLRRNFETGTFIHRFVEQLTYVTDESGLVEETRLDSDHQLSENLLFRFQNNKSWRILKKTFGTSHGPSILQTLTENDAFSYSLIMSSTIDEGTWFVTSYNFSIAYRRNLYKQWLYLDLIPGLDFPKNWSFRRTPYFISQIEALFGW